MTERELAPGVVIFEIISDKNQRFIVCSAIGHMYSLFPIERNRKKYPIFEAKWSPRHSAIVREKRRILEILKVISKISEGASGFIHACDYDREGELIGYNILEYACNHKYELSMRAKFSSLTDSEINQSFNNLLEPDIRIAEAGKARHLIDFIFGINLSRALVNCLSVSNQNNRYYNLSIGRVQGPTLGFMVDREVKIRNHVPDPVWYVTGKFEKDGSFFKANLITSIHKFSEIQKILTTCRTERGTIKEIIRLDKKLNPPTPFNISNLQKEAFRIFKMPPATTLSVAESLYLSALISYPRTSSQKLPSSIGYKKILERLNMYYPTRNKNFVQDLLKINHLVPYQGNEEDPAHPAIYPTGVKHKKLNILQHKILDLIIKRFLSTFGTTAVSKYIEVTINVNGHDFMAKGNTILNYGWIPIYEPYFSINQSNLPELGMGESVEVNEVTAIEDYTKPPARYNQATLLDTMESEGIGTKSTRADTINILIKRKYIIQGKIGVEPTELGFTILNTMKKFIPEIVSTKLSSFLESTIRRIEDGDLETINIHKYLEKYLEIPLNKIKINELEIGDEIKNGLNDSENGKSIGKCPKCHLGEMILINSRKSDKRFIACSEYRLTGCKTIASVPQIGKIKRSNTICSCGWPILIFVNRKKIWSICVNRVCPHSRFNKTDSHHKSDLKTSI
jgi:DNA topoisomerase-1